jgi:ADP-ribose pyrophosphatase YjhB (NUDIX family)
MSNLEPTQTIINDNEIEISFPLEENKPTKERKTVRCIIKHWENEEYLVIKEKKFDGIMTLLGGGIEENQTIEEAVKTEIREESGYTKIKSITITPFRIHNKFYNKKKEQNQYSIISLAVVELESGEKEERTLEEIDLIDIKWVKKDELLNSVDTNMDKFFIEKAL